MGGESRGFPERLLLPMNERLPPASDALPLLLGAASEGGGNVGAKVSKLFTDVLLFAAVELVLLPPVLLLELARW